MSEMHDIEAADDIEILATEYGGEGPHGMAYRVVRVLPSGVVFRVDFIVTDGRADPRLTPLPRDWKSGDATR